MMRPPEQIIVLDRERRIAFTMRARFRMAGLDRPFDLRDLSKPRKLYFALVSWLWACLVEADAAAFETPEDLAKVIPMDAATLTPLLAALTTAIKAANDEKKTEGSKPSEPSPASNSA